ncbi:MAG TPA: hypothetical protein PLB51_01115 [Candidatus Paceibacterota bacterium]|jgi:hypothetical protein|nr:hypothetical protein [Candidatus Paceibacterota bacterium]
MHRVNTIYTVHKVKIIAFKAVFALGALALVASAVSFTQVFENSKHTDNILAFVMSAVISTEFPVQVLFVALCIFAYFSVRDLIDIIRVRR